MTKLWFKAKEYGYGWYPVTWEGWIIILISIILILMNAVLFVEKNIFIYFANLIIIVGALLVICYNTGEKARWRWGKNNNIFK